MTDDSGVHAGQAVYSPLVLAIYDFYVLGLSNHLLWRCPTRELRNLYDRNVSRRHLDVGVGTGYFLDKARWPVPDPAITLVDLNANSLSAAARRIGRYPLQTLRANALQPMPPIGPFNSVGLCYLLHCLPGTLHEKAIVFSHLQPLLSPGARVFGATIVQGSAPRSRPAQALMNAYNHRGVFSNASDTVEELKSILVQRFADVRVQLHGTVALFEATAHSRAAGLRGGGE
jgi:SAM-dependent methyltransferase